MSETSNKTRLEHDCIGQMEVPANVYWGIHTQRAIGNFPVSGITDSQHPELIRAMPRSSAPAPSPMRN